MKRLLIILLGCLFSMSSISGEIVIDESGQLLRNGQPYQAIGINYFNAFYRTLVNPADKSYKKGFEELSQFKIPFIRVMIGGFWPEDLKLYRDNPTLYFKLLDEFILSAEKSNLGIVASLNWNFATAADIVGEPASSIGVTGSKTQEFIKKYTRDVVSRYANNKTIWIWEFGNELMLYADLPNSKLFRPKTNVAKGTPLVRNPLDDLNAKDAVGIFDVFSREVMSIEPMAVLSTGNALPRPYAWHNTVFKNTLKQWDSDTEEQFCSILQRDNPASYKLVSVHVYPSRKDVYFGNSLNDYDSLIKATNECAKKSGKVLFVGEFGADSNVLTDGGARNEFFKILAAIKKNQVPLSALWVYDFSYQSSCCSVTANNQRRYQLEELMKFNQSSLMSNTNLSH